MFPGSLSHDPQPQLARVAARDPKETLVAHAGPYEPFYKGYHDGSKKLRTVAGVPDDIARLVEKALKSDNPAPRYSGPFHAKIFLFLKWILPARMFAWFTRLTT